MFKKCTNYVAEKYDKKTYHPVHNIHKVRRFRPLCIVERKKHVGFWKKSSMNPTYLTLRDLLADKDFELALESSPRSLPPKLKVNRGLRLGCNLSTKIATEQEIEIGSGDRMTLTFDMKNVVRDSVSSEELLNLLENNYLDHSHPLHLNVKYPKHPLCVVVETLSTAQTDDRLEKERVLTRIPDDTDTESSTITVDILSKYSSNVKSSHKYKISPGTVLAYKAVGFKVDTNGKIVLDDVPERVEVVNEGEVDEETDVSTPPLSSGATDTTSEEAPEEEASDACTKPVEVTPDTDGGPELSVTDIQIDETMSTSGVDTKVSKEELDLSSTLSVESEEEDSEPPLMIRDVHRSDLVKVLKEELESLFDVSYFHKLQTDLKTLMSHGKRNEFQLVQLLLYHANIYHANPDRDNFVTFPYTYYLMCGEKKMSWRFLLTKLGFSVSKCIENVTVTFPSNDDDDVLEAMLGVVNSLLNMTDKSRDMVSKLHSSQLTQLQTLLEVALHDVEYKKDSNQQLEEIVTKDSNLMEFLSSCGLVRPLGSSWVLLEKCDRHALVDVYIVVTVLSYVRKPVVKDKRLLRLRSFRHVPSSSK